MSFRGASKSGGFLRNVDATWVSYVFTTDPPGDGPSKRDDIVYLVPRFAVDGKEGKGETQHLFMGTTDQYSIDNGGLELSHQDGSPVRYSGKIAGGRFLDSLIDAGFPDQRLPDLEAGEPLNLEAVNGTRLHLDQEVDVEATKKLGKRIDKKDSSKSYDRTRTIVTAVHQLPAAGASASGTGSKETAATLAASTVRALVYEAGGKLAKSKLSMGFMRKLGKHELRDDARTLAFDNAFLGKIEGVKYDEAKQMLELVA